MNLEVGICRLVYYLYNDVKKKRLIIMLAGLKMGLYYERWQKRMGRFKVWKFTYNSWNTEDGRLYARIIIISIGVTCETVSIQLFHGKVRFKRHSKGIE